MHEAFCGIREGVKVVELCSISHLSDDGAVAKMGLQAFGFEERSTSHISEARYGAPGFWICRK